MGRINLLEIFKDIRIEFEGSSGFGRYRALYRLERRANHTPVTERDLALYVANLRKRYPDKRFKLSVVYVNGRMYHVITKDRKDQSGRVQRDRIPIYVDLEEQKFYVPKSYYTKMPRLASYIIHRTLGSLGVARQIYVATVSRGYGGGL